MTDLSIVTVDADNLEVMGLFCVKNKKHVGGVAKRSWLNQRFGEGMRFKLLLADTGEQSGFLSSTSPDNTPGGS